MGQLIMVGLWQEEEEFSKHGVEGEHTSESCCWECLQDSCKNPHPHANHTAQFLSHTKTGNILGLTHLSINQTPKSHHANFNRLIFMGPFFIHGQS